MKKDKIALLMILLLLLTVTIQSAGQATAVYGSNNGKYLTINGTRIYYEEYGNGIPLLLLHGGFGSINDFKKVIPKLSDSFRIIAPDSPGHGRSEQADTLSYELLASFFSKMIDLLQLDSVYIIGWSDGGNAALILAADRPEKVKKIVVSGSNTRLDDSDPGTLNFLKQLNPKYVETTQKDWLTEYIKKSPQKDKWEKFILDMQKMWSTKIVVSEPKLAQIKNQILIVLGDRDAIKIEHGIEMLRTIKNSQFCVLPNTSHNVFEEQPDLITQIAINFFF